MSNASDHAAFAARAGMSISTAAWDGYSLPTALASMGRLGITGIEMAFIKGYVSDFTDADLNAGLARELREEMARHGQHCRVLSAHIDLGEPGALESFRVRVRFAAELGATWLITNAAGRALAPTFFESLGEMTAMARDAGLTVCLENPGDGSDNLINRAADLPAFLQQLDAAVWGINYDPGNLVSHRPDLDVVQDALAAVPHARHLHLKAVGCDPEGYGFKPMGEGDINYRPILQAVAEHQLPFSLELPFRLRRDINAQPLKLPQPLDLDEIERGMSASLRWVRAHYPGSVKS